MAAPVASGAEVAAVSGLGALYGLAGRVVVLVLVLCHLRSSV